MSGTIWFIQLLFSYNKIDVNIKGVLNGVAAVLPSMMARKTGIIHFLSLLISIGDIVNVSSDAGRKVFIPGVVYCASKWAVEVFISQYQC